MGNKSNITQKNEKIRELKLSIIDLKVNVECYQLKLKKDPDNQDLKVQLNLLLGLLETQQRMLTQLQLTKVTAHAASTFLDKNDLADDFNDSLAQITNKIGHVPYTRATREEEEEDDDDDEGGSLEKRFELLNDKDAVADKDMEEMEHFLIKPVLPPAPPVPSTTHTIETRMKQLNVTPEKRFKDMDNINDGEMFERVVEDANLDANLMKLILKKET